VNLLPLCQSRQALLGAAAPARRFERILVRCGVPVNEYSEENGPGEHAFPKLVLNVMKL